MLNTNKYQFLISLLLWFTSMSLSAQESGKQTVRIVSGKSVNLNAEAENAGLGFIWLKNGQIYEESGQATITVDQDGIYTVIAKGEFCDSDMSDPVEVIIIPNQPAQSIDLTIKNPADRHAALIGQPIHYNIIVNNLSSEVALLPYIEISIPDQTRYQHSVGNPPGRLEFDPIKNVLKWYLDSLSGGSRVELEISVIAEKEGVAEQIAVVTSASQEANPSDNKSKSMVTIIALHIPNVFTPNGDGINDTFEIKGMEFLPSNRVTIFNHDGLEVFKSNSYKNDWNGNGLNNGTYYYIIEILMPNGQWERFKGYLTLLR